MMPILIKSDDVRSGRKAKVRHGRSRAVQKSMGQNKIWSGKRSRNVAVHLVFSLIAKCANRYLHLSVNHTFRNEARLTILGRF